MSNKKIKIGLLASMLLGVTFSLALPIISCSSSSGTELNVSNQDPTKLNSLTTSISDQFKGEVAGEITFDKQKETYNSLSYDSLPQLAKNNLREIVTFGDFKWDDAVKDITLEKGTFPSTPGARIPNINFKINLNEGFTPTGDTENNLTVSIPIGNSSTTEATNLNVSEVAGKKQELADSIKSLFNFKTLQQQQQTYDALKDGLTGDQLTKLKATLSFGSSSNTWDVVVKTHKVTTSDIRLVSGQAIPSITIEIELKWNYIATSETKDKLLITIDNLGTATTVNQVLTVVQVADFDKSPGIAGIKGLFIGGANNVFSKQKEAFLKLGDAPLKPEITALFNGIVTFGSNVNWDQVVESISIVLPENPTITIGSAIPSIQIRINLKPIYSPTSETNALLTQDIAFMTGDVNDTFVSALKITAADASDKATKITNLTSEFKKLFNNTQTFAQQSEIYNNLNGRKLNSTEIATITDILTFETVAEPPVTVNWTDIVKDATISFTTPAPTLTPSSSIPEVKITINLNDDYVTNNEAEKAKLTFNSNTLGTFERKSLTIEFGENWTQNTIKGGIIDFITEPESNLTSEAEKANYELLRNKTLSASSAGSDLEVWNQLGGKTSNKPLLTFTYGSEKLSWFDVVASVTFTGADLETGQVTIPSINMIINLKNEYKSINSASEEKLTRTYENLGNFTDKLKAIPNAAWTPNTILNGISSFIKGEKTSTIAEQKARYNELLSKSLSKTSTGSDLEAWNQIAGTTTPATNAFMSFTDSSITEGSVPTITWSNAVKNVTFTGAALVDGTADIPDITMHINLMDKYKQNTTNAATVHLHKTYTNIGPFTNGIGITKNSAVETAFKNWIVDFVRNNDSATTIEARKANFNALKAQTITSASEAPYDSAWGKISGTGTGNENPLLTFTLGSETLLWNDVVSNVSFVGGEVNETLNIPYITMTIKLKPNYIPSNDSLTTNLTIAYTDLGTWTEQVTITQSDLWMDGRNFPGVVKNRIIGDRANSTILKQRVNYNTLIRAEGYTSADTEFWKEIKKYLEFDKTQDTPKQWDDVVEKVIFKGAAINGETTSIPTITMDVILKERYSPIDDTSKSLLKFNLTNLGVFSDSIIIKQKVQWVENTIRGGIDNFIKTRGTSNLNPAQTEAKQRQNYSDLLGKTLLGTSQGDDKIIWDKLANQTEGLLNISVPGGSVGGKAGTNKYWNDVVESVTFKGIHMSNSTTAIPIVTMEINLKPIYISADAASDKMISREYKDLGNIGGEVTPLASQTNYLGENIKDNPFSKIWKNISSLFKK